MVYHQAIPSFPHRHYFIHLPHQLHKRGKLIILVKGVGGAIAPIQDMVKKTPCVAGDARGIHGA